MNDPLTVNDARRLINAASDCEVLYTDRLATIYEVSFTIITFTIIWGLSWL